MKDIIFVHGMFQNPKSWDQWIAYFRELGYNCVAPAWPLHDGEPAILRQTPPEGLGDLHLSEVVASIETVVSNYESPIVIGHSVGGLIAQLLLQKKIAGAAVAVNSVAPNAMLDFDWGFIKNSALIANPFKGNEPFYMDKESFHGAFANSLDEAASDLAFENFATHDSRNVLRDCMGDDGKIDVDAPHAPLLLIAGEKDEIIPNTLVLKNFEAYTDAGSVISFKEFEGRSHYICGEPGWEEVARYIASWLENINIEKPKGSLLV